MTCTSFFLLVWKGFALGIGAVCGICVILAILMVVLSRVLHIPILPKRPEG